MSKENNSSQWPKAFAIVFGTVAISAAAYLLREPQMMWAILCLVLLVDRID